MSRPVLPSPERRAVARNLSLDLVAAIGVGVTVALVSALLPTIARQGGLEPIGLAALGAAPYIANLLGAFAGRVGPQSPVGLSVVRSLGAASLVLVLLMPIPPVMIAVALVYWVSLSLGSPLQLRLWGALYPAAIRGRVVGVQGMARAAAGALAALGGGVVADRLGGPPAVALAGAVGMLAAVAYAGFRAPAALVPSAYSAREALRALGSRPVLARVALAQGFYGGGMVAAGPLFALVHVDRLGLTLADVGVLGVLAAVATTVASPIWGAVSDRFGPLVGMRIGGIMGFVALVAYALAPDVVVLWLASLLAGAASGSIEVGVAAVVSEQTTLATRAAAMAGWNAITGARGIVAAFLMSALVQAGIVDVSLGLLLCAASSGLGVVLFARARSAARAETRVWELGPRPRAVAVPKPG